MEEMKSMDTKVQVFESIVESFVIFFLVVFELTPWETRRGREKLIPDDDEDPDEEGRLGVMKDGRCEEAKTGKLTSVTVKKPDGLYLPILYAPSFINTQRNGRSIAVNFLFSLWLACEKSNGPIY